MVFSRFVCWLALGAMLTARSATMLQASDSPAVDFISQVQPILAKRCFVCHGPDESSREAGLRLDVRDAATSKLDSGGIAVSPHHPAESELLRRISSQDDADRMPPAESGPPLTTEQVETLRRWIAAGAPYNVHWSFRPVQQPEPPVVVGEDWVRNPIDRFILARLEREGLKPSPEAAPTALLRRLSLDLTGLPPTIAEIAEFQADDSPDAYERAVDRLLASPHFGERWGRHWLDLAHYADSDGYLNDDLRPTAWRYRDWVVNAVNRDLPFNRFTIEQLAGDLLPDATDDQRTATGFLRNTLRNVEAGVDLEEYRVKEIVDRVSTVGAGWLGLTLGCAECHAHKYDPVSHREFYSLFAFFNETEDVELPDTKARAVAQLTPPRESFVHLRGNYRQRGAEAPPDVPAALPPLSPRGERADRLDLARWLVDSAQPLTPRVTVNRWWMHLFGRGLVATVDNFGIGGEAPTHPELLDWLAAELVKRQWSQKAMLRLIVTSAAYRQSSAGREELDSLDPQNLLLARQSRVRLEAEGVRDAALAASGLLDRRIGGPSICPPQPEYVASISRNVKWDLSEGADLYRRGMYILFRRATPYPMLLTFDAPDSTVACTRRERSNSPLQALTLLNDPVFFECAESLGRTLADETAGTIEQRLAMGFRRCLSREPLPEELRRLHELWKQRRAAAQAANAETDDATAWIVVARVLMNLDEFITRE